MGPTQERYQLWDENRNVYQSVRMDAFGRREGHKPVFVILVSHLRNDNVLPTGNSVDPFNCE
jgi:hypothetical protein